MANDAIKMTALAACTAPISADIIVLTANVSGNAVTYQVTLNVLLNNTAANVTSNVVSGTTLVVSGNSTPANNTDNDSRPNNSIWVDGSYIYHWDGTEIKRAALSTF